LGASARETSTTVGGQGSRRVGIGGTMLDPRHAWGWFGCVFTRGSARTRGRLAEGAAASAARGLATAGAARTVQTRAGAADGPAAATRRACRPACSRVWHGGLQRVHDAPPTGERLDVGHLQPRPAGRVRHRRAGLASWGLIQGGGALAAGAGGRGAGGGGRGAGGGGRGAGGGGRGAGGGGRGAGCPPPPPAPRPPPPRPRPPRGRPQGLLAQQEPSSAAAAALLRHLSQGLAHGRRQRGRLHQPAPRVYAIR
jgi:hypothetical protein